MGTAGARTRDDAALFDDWETWPDERFERCQWPPTGERLTRDTFAARRAQGGIVIIHPADEARQEDAVRACLARTLPMIASDGAWDNGRTHPRVAGTNSRLLGRYVHEADVLTLMDALRKMSLAPADHLARRDPAMRRKGRIPVVADADSWCSIPSRSSAGRPPRPDAGAGRDRGRARRRGAVLRRALYGAGCFPDGQCVAQPDDRAPLRIRCGGENGSRCHVNPGASRSSTL